LTKAAQQNAIYRLNKIAQTTNLTTYASNMINGWYRNDTVTVADESYLPQDWQDGIGTIPGTDVEKLYHKVEAPYCRGCHVSMDTAARVTNNPEEMSHWQERDAAFKQVICGGGSTVQRNHTMPNSLVTFNRMWADPEAVALLQRWSGDNKCLSRLDPKLK
jgi:hypothetical protein